MFGNECEPCQHCKQCKQRIARRYLHLSIWCYCWIVNTDCNVSPQQMFLSSKAGMRRRDATRGTFLVKHLSRGFLRVHFVSILWKLCLQCSLCAIFTACNLHCVCGPQLSISHRLLTHPTDPFPTVLWTIHPLHIARCNRSLLSKEWLLLKITSL